MYKIYWVDLSRNRFQMYKIESINYHPTCNCNLRILTVTYTFAIIMYFYLVG